MLRVAFKGGVRCVCAFPLFCCRREQQGPESVCVAAVCSAGRVIHHLEARIEPGSGLMDVRSV